MAEYIERDAIVKFLRGREGDFIDNIGKAWSAGMEAAASWCEKFPAADAVEVVHAKWRRVYEDSLGWVDICSICKSIVDDPKNYCPHCGADMRGTDNG